jgi:hypothetical protein
MLNNVPDLDFDSIIKNDPNVNSSGYFKDLMDSINGYISHEFQSGRITGTDYANVYLGAMQYALQNATQYALQKHVQDQQAELLAVQASTAKEQSTKDLLVKDAQINNANADKFLKEQQKINLVAEALNIPKQGSLLDSQKQLTDAKQNTETKQQNVLDSQVSVYTNQAKAFKAKHSRDVLESIGSLATVSAGIADDVTVLGVTSGTVTNAISAATPWPTAV